MTQKSSDAFEQPVVAGTEEELRAYQKGVAVLLMPVRDGWKVSYLSGGDWEQEPGTESQLVLTKELEPGTESQLALSKELEPGTESLLQ